MAPLSPPSHTPPVSPSQMRGIFVSVPLQVMGEPTASSFTSDKDYCLSIPLYNNGASKSQSPIYSGGRIESQSPFISDGESNTNPHL